MLNLPIYLDNSATTACDKAVVEAMLPYFTQYFGNASSRSHVFGWQATAAVDAARQQVAGIINATVEEIIFTSGATEACNLALRGITEIYAGKGNHIITTKTEHKAVLDTCKQLHKKGADITYLNVLPDGRIDLNELKAAITPATILIAIMYANNETGVLMPVKEIGDIAHEKDVLFFCDATQAVGKIKVDVIHDNIDVLAFSGHKIYGPKGVGALYVRRKNPRVKLMAQITGGGQEKNLRSGTLNVPGIVGLGKACTICSQTMESEAARLAALRDKLETALLQLEATFLNSNPEHRLPQVTNISFKHLNSSKILSAINNVVAASSGSACTSGSLDPSYVLTAMGIKDGLAKAAVRFSLGRFTTAAEIDFCITEIQKKIMALRQEDPVWHMYKTGLLKE